MSCHHEGMEDTTDSFASFLDRYISLQVRRDQDVERHLGVMNNRFFDESYLGIDLRDSVTLNLPISGKLHRGSISIQQSPTRRRNNFASKDSSMLAAQCKESGIAYPYRPPLVEPRMQPQYFENTKQIP